MPAQSFSFKHPDKERLEHLLSVRGDLGRAEEALSSLVDRAALFGGGGLLAEAVFTLAVVAYVRCFASGRRKGLSADIYAGNSRLLKDHEEFKSIRDQHIAHAVGVLEGLHVSVAAVDQNSPALGIGAVGVFFSHTRKRSTLLLLRRVVRFATIHVDHEIEAVGSRMATQLLGKAITWKQSQRAFRMALGNDGFAEATLRVDAKVMKKAPRMLRGSE